LRIGRITAAPNLKAAFVPSGFPCGG